MTQKKPNSDGDSLRFRVAAHLMQDLGLNLYTSLPRVLVEFVANAHDANAKGATIRMNGQGIEDVRKLVRRQYAVEKEEAQQAARNGDPTLLEALVPLADRVLPADITITIEDDGHGMSRSDLAEKFLVAGRRRRIEEDTTRTEGNLRPLMGRKGLGKLAGFGVARRVEVTSRRAGEEHATKVTLDYDELIDRGNVSDIPVPEERLDDGGGFPVSGTRVVLSRLVYEAAKSREATIAAEIGEHFSSLRPEEFRMVLNSEEIRPPARVYAYGYPNPETPPEQLIDHTLETDDGDSMSFKYRVRFTAPKHNLRAGQRGVRIYAHHRLASAPDLLDVNSGMHGFRNTEYLDAIVEADFIDEGKRNDYIATDRQSLRWEVERLTALRDFLTKEMTAGCVAYQGKRDREAQEEADRDLVTRRLLDEAQLPSHRRRVATRIAGLLAATSDGGVNGEEYRTQLEIFLDGLSQGDLMGSLGKLARQQHPNFHEVVDKISELTEREFADFVRYVEGRVSGIAALRKLFESVDFKQAKNEDELHRLFEKNPWLLDPAFSQFLASDQNERAVLDRLARHLEIGKGIPKGYDPAAADEVKRWGTNKRPDLVFLIGSTSRRRLVIVELKAPNTPLHFDHLSQLQGYMQRAEEWLRSQGGDAAKTDVSGLLVGSRADPASRAEKARLLEWNIEKHMDNAAWKVFDIGEILERTQRVHDALLRSQADLETTQTSVPQEPAAPRLLATSAPKR